MVWLARRVARHLPLAARPRQARCRRDAGKFARRSPSPGEMLVSLLTQSPSPGEPSATSPTVGLARRDAGEFAHPVALARRAVGDFTHSWARQASCPSPATRCSPSPGEMLVSLLTQSPSPGEPSATSPTVGLARRVTRRLPPVSGACQGELLPASPVVWLARRVARHLPLAARPRQARCW